MVLKIYTTAGLHKFFQERANLRYFGGEGRGGSEKDLIDRNKIATLLF